MSQEEKYINKAMIYLLVIYDPTVGLSTTILDIWTLLDPSLDQMKR